MLFGRAVHLEGKLSVLTMPAVRKSPFQKGAVAKEKDEEENEPAAEGGDEGDGPIQPTLHLDSSEAVGFVKFFQSMEPPPERTVRFFYRKKEGEFYSCHGDDAIYIAQECFHTMSVVKYLGKNNELPAVTVSTSNFNSFASQLLTERQYRVEVWGENKVCSAPPPSPASCKRVAANCILTVEIRAGQRHVEHRPAGLAGQPGKLRGDCL